MHYTFWIIGVSQLSAPSFPHHYPGQSTVHSIYTYVGMCVCVCVFACVRMCVRVCVCVYTHSS